MSGSLVHIVATNINPKPAVSATGMAKYTMDCPAATAETARTVTMKTVMSSIPDTRRRRRY